jgi:hypothetical protein
VASPVHHTTITTGLQFRQTLAAGPYAWPGGYPYHFDTSDSAVLCWDCAKKEGPGILRAIRDGDHSGWRVVGCDINWEDPDLQCAHCNKDIESAYG